MVFAIWFRNSCHYKGKMIWCIPDFVVCLKLNGCHYALHGPSSPRPNMADNTESTIEQGGTEETVGLMVPDTTEDEGANGTTDITPSNGRLQYMVELL